MPRKPKHILLNAMHATTGGGLTYLRGTLPHLAKEEDFVWTLLVPDSVELEVPENVTVRTVPKMGFAKGHMWEQFCLPFSAWRWGAKIILCNANYTPLLADCSIPIIHTTPRAAGQAQSTGMKVYWKVLRWLTTLSVWNAPLAFSVANHVILDYVGPWAAKKVRVAPPAVAMPEDNGFVRDGNLVVSIGDFYAQKDYPLLVRAFQKLREQRPGTKLMIIGRPVDVKVRDEVLALVRELKLANAVTLTGGMPHDRLMQALGRASLYVSTSKAECFNIPVLEAMASGVPCVLASEDFQQEVAGDTAVYVTADKGGDVAAAFAVAMFGVLENKLIAESLRKKGLARSKLFTWQATAKVIADGLRTL